MKEKLLDKDTIDAYHSYVQSEIRSDLNSISLGPGKLPTRLALGLTAFGFCCLLVGILLVALRMQHVYFWDWEVQFVGPFFFILCLLCLGGASYLVVIASRRSNRFRRELYFRPLGDYGIAAVHRDDLLYEHEMKHDLKSGTTPHKTVMPRSDAYSMVNMSKERERRSGHHNQGFRPGPGDPQRRHHDPHRRPPGGPDRRPPHPDDRRRGPPPEGRRGPPDDRDRRRPPDGRRPPPEGDYRRGPPPDDRRRYPDDRRGPPGEGRRSPPREGFRGPPPEGQRGPPPPGFRYDVQRPPPDRRGPPPDRRGPPDDDRRGPPPGDRRPRGSPQFRERSPDDDMGKIRLEDNKESESEL